MEKKTKVLLASAVIVGLVAVASAQTGLFKGSFYDLKKARISSSTECLREVDKLGIYASINGRFVTNLSSEVYSLVGSQVPSIVWSEVQATQVPSIVTSWASSSNPSKVSSEVNVDDEYVDKCLTLQEKKSIVSKSRAKAVKEARESINKAKLELKSYDAMYKQLNQEETLDTTQKDFVNSQVKSNSFKK